MAASRARRAGEAFTHSIEEVQLAVDRERAALVAALAHAKRIGANCTVGDADTGPCFDCVSSHKTCWISGSDVRGCCAEGFECLQRSPGRGACKRPDSIIARRYVRAGFGRILQCLRE